MNKFELYKNLSSKVENRMKQVGPADRFAGAVPDRKEQRKLDQAQGLVPFAIKLNGDLVSQLRQLAETRQMGLNELVDELLRKGMAA
jgi:hypothetical protein